MAQDNLIINPTPQQIQTYPEKENVIIPSSYNFKIDDNRVKSYAINNLYKLIPNKSEKKSSFTIIAGIKGDRSIKKYSKHIPNKPEGYFLSVTTRQIVLAGYDERGLYYATQTLSQLIHDKSLPPIEIKDYPDVPFRGVVEGFYGTPWSHSARLRQLEFYGKNKMNTYLYGPKDDPYHSVPNWRKPYPAKEAEQIKELVNTAHKNGVIFYWAIHPGADIKWNDTDRDLLLAKFESMYQLGVRAFAVFFDDIAGEGAKADKQANLLNYIDDHFIKTKKDIAPLIMCPTEYNKSWANVKGGYLTTLGKQLNPTIQIMWTGNRVIACIDKPTLQFINPLIERKAFIWWNFPVSDYVRDHLLLGPIYGNGTNIKNDISGFVANPMEHAEASKIALYSVADYSWNMNKYDSDLSWKRAIHNVLPGAGKELLTFASHCSALGPNGHGFNRDESVLLKPFLQKLEEQYKQEKNINQQALSVVRMECDRLREASDILLTCTGNRPLIDEISPWLIQAKLIGEYGLDVMNMLNYAKEGKDSAFLQKYRHAKALLSQMYTVDVTYNQNPFQPGVKVGSQSLLPTLNSLFSMATEQFNQASHTMLDSRSFYQPYSLFSNVPQLANQPVRTRGNMVNISPSNEVIKWPSGGYITINMDYPRTVQSIQIDLGTPHIASSFQCEISDDNEIWQTVPMEQKNGETKIIFQQIPTVKMKYIRFKSMSNDELKVYFKQFRFTVKQ